MVKPTKENVKENIILYQGKESSQQLLEVLHIQMEYCEGTTLRSVIDKGLYENKERIWRLLREIVEGLVYVHSQVSFIGRLL
jgi:translation initiation factor 2-alpha kinase 4